MNEAGARPLAHRAVRGGSGPGLVYPPNFARNSPTTLSACSAQCPEFQRFQAYPQSDRLRIACDFSEEGAGSEGCDSDEGQETLLDRGGTLVGRRHEKQESGGKHGADTKEREG